MVKTFEVHDYIRDWKYMWDTVSFKLGAGVYSLANYIAAYEKT